MVSTRKKKEQNRRFCSQMSKSDTDLMNGQSNHDVQTESRERMTYTSTSSDNTNNPTQGNYPLVDMHTLGKKLLVKYKVKWIT